MNDCRFGVSPVNYPDPDPVYAEPFNESALTIHWQPVQDTREAMRGRLKGYKVQYNTLITTLG